MTNTRAHTHKHIYIERGEMTMLTLYSASKIELLSITVQLYHFGMKIDAYQRKSHNSNGNFQ